MPGDIRKTDVLIAGGAFAGLALAIALRQALGSSFTVVVADPAFARSGADPRASAIAAAARRLLETIGVWQDVADDARRSAADIPDLRRRCRAGRAFRTHG
jgi:2-octaprenyl-6-methoxyphenol hydroxylase